MDEHNPNNINPELERHKAREADENRNDRIEAANQAWLKQKYTLNEPSIMSELLELSIFSDEVRDYLGELFQLSDDAKDCGVAGTCYCCNDIYNLSNLTRPSYNDTEADFLVCLNCRSKAEAAK